MSSSLKRLQQGKHHNPFDFLGRHTEGGKTIVRAFMPHAETVKLTGFGEMTRVTGSDVFEARLSQKQAEKLPEHYELEWREKADGTVHKIISPYSFEPQLSDYDLHLFSEGKHWHAWYFLGAHLKTIDGIDGSLFAVWAPGVQRISVVGDFNGWNGLRHPMRNRGHSGVWELFIPGLHPGDIYKYEIYSRDGHLLTKADPYSREMALRPDTTSRICASRQRYKWQDDNWLKKRTENNWLHHPMSVYEVHLGSWQLDENGHFLNYRELAHRLVEYVSEIGYTHIELLPIMEHPLDESWGYQVSGYYAPTSRFGSPDDFRYFIDYCHQHDIGVILDWVPAHFPKDDFALARFNGDHLYEHADPKRGEHQDWGTLIFDYGRHEVRNFLIANALYWIEEYHVDGLRVDAVASMLYLDYSRDEGGWEPNEYGGRENLEALAFLKETNEIIHEKFPGVMTIAEESTAWPMVSRPVYMGGLGFSMKWNMGWMHDTLAYFQQDPVHRKYHHDNLTFSQLYAYTENFVLPFSHDEVVHMKQNMLSKMPGDDWQKFAQLRLLYTYHFAHPGKKLLFMGGEFGQWEEWNEKKALDWALLEFPNHQGIKQLVTDLNHLYKNNSALHYFDFDAEGFQWIDCMDSDQSIISFLRHGPEGFLVCIFNFTPVIRQNYRIGVPPADHYEEILNSDSEVYQGANVGNEGYVQTQPTPWMGFEQSLELTLPPLGGIMLKPA